MPKRELTDREILELNRVDDGPDDIPQGRKPYYHPADRLPVKFPEPSIVIEEACPPVQDLYSVLVKVVEDGGFQLRRKERVALDAALVEDAKLLEQINETSEDRIRAKRKEERAKAEEPLIAVETVVESARQHRRVLKERRAALRIKLGPTIALMLERAIQSADTTIAIFEENERSRAEEFTVPFERSNTLKAAIAARRLLHEPAKIARNAPDLIDIPWIYRLLGITDDTFAADE